MALIRLSDKEYQTLYEIALSTNDVRILRRAQAILWLSEGEAVEEVANQLMVAPRTVYRWVTRYNKRKHLDMVFRVADAQRSGRPKTVQGVIDPLISKILDEDPRAHSYAATVWTVPLLTQYLKDVHQLSASSQSVRLCIERLDMAWKRPRYTLARRSPTWRQEKGG
jgi:transposase